MNKLTTYIAFGISLLAASCTSDDMGEKNGATLSGDGKKTPIAVQTNLSAAPLTRAYDKTFEENDQLFACIEAGKEEAGVFTPVSDPKFTWADNFTMGETIDNGGEAGVGNITTSEALSPVLYWDDFSSTVYDLRESGRGIRLKYGYCMNGGTPADFDKPAGTLTWTVQADQTEASKMKQSDLLFATTQDMITYGHDPESRGTLKLPYTHAMSKITIKVSTGESYAAEQSHFGSAALTLNHMQTKASVNAPAGTVTPSENAADVKDVVANTLSTANTTATYQAIVAPTALTAGNVLATITNIDANDYTIPLTPAILSAWAAEDKLTESEEVLYNGVAESKPLTRSAIDPGKGYLTKPGIHYILNVTVDKQTITIRATITDWDSVEATGIGQINFAGDVTEKGDIAEELKAHGFDVYKSSTNSSFTSKSTSVTFAGGNWGYAPAIYWQNASDNSFFRALSPVGTDAGSISQGVDVLWGTSGDAAISPRTGDVELDFIHAMSKLSMQLETTSDASRVDLTGAKISISNLYTEGAIDMVTGVVNTSAQNAEADTPPIIITKPKSEKAINLMAAPISNYAVMPQALTDASVITITLADGVTTYTLNLTNCLDGNDTPVDTWEPGKHYSYVIHIAKAGVTFRAKVRDWNNAGGSGNATLEWD